MRPSAAGDGVVPSRNGWPTRLLDYEIRTQSSPASSLASPVPIWPCKRWEQPSERLPERWSGKLFRWVRLDSYRLSSGSMVGRRTESFGLDDFRGHTLVGGDPGSYFASGSVSLSSMISTSSTSSVNRIRLRSTRGCCPGSAAQWTVASHEPAASVMTGVKSRIRPMML